MFAVEETTPKFGPLITLPGVAKTGVFVALNASARKSRWHCSEIANFRKTEKSRFLPQSDRNELRPRFPNVYRAGTANALVSIHSAGLGFARPGFPTRFARTKELPVLARSPWYVTSYALPERRLAIALICQPETRARTARLDGRKKRFLPK